MATVAAEQLADWVSDAREKTMLLIADLSDEQLVVPKLPTINPLAWEIGHVAWFQEHWVLRHVGGLPPVQDRFDQLYDSIAIEHGVRWDLPILSREDTISYRLEVQDRVLQLLADSPLSEQLEYFVKLSVFHEDMHAEALTYTRQTLAYPAPELPMIPAVVCEESKRAPELSHADSDAEIPAGDYTLGARRDEPFVFDNEMWSHPITIQTARIARTAVTQSEFANFVDDEGYRRREYWCDDGWQWRRSCQAEHPVYWQRQASGWLRRDFDRWVPLEAERPMLHVNWFEADAYCRWAGRRLPTEAEWEVAASLSLQPESQSVARRFPWGNEPPNADLAQLDWQTMGAAKVDEKGQGDSPLGCRQMIGNVWEWTATTFQPYPGFVVGPYKEYSRTCFGQCKVLRGGCWVSRSRLIRNTWRNFYLPDRRDVWAGFRTCAY